jgi:hypothetical protein
MSQARAITAVERFGVFYAWNGRCFWCRELVKFAECHIDHVIPVSAPNIEILRNLHSLPPTFEIDSFENWAPSCQGCNLKKRAMVLSQTPAMAINLQAIRERAPKAKLIAEEFERDRQVAPLLVKLQMAVERGDISQHEINLIASKVPPPEGNVELSKEWGVQQKEGKVLVVHLSPLYTPEGRKKFRAERQRQIEQLSSQFARLNAEIAKLDITTAHGKEKLTQLSKTKTEIERELIRLKSSGLGFTGHLDQ